MAIELKYAKPKTDGSGLTSQIQRAVGQSLIASLRHKFVICVIVYKNQKKEQEAGEIEKLKKVLQEKHNIYLVIRPLKNS